MNNPIDNLGLDTCFGQKTRKIQRVSETVNSRYAQEKTDQGATNTTPPGTNRNTLLIAPTDQIPKQKEIIDGSCLLDHRRLGLQSLYQRGLGDII